MGLVLLLSCAATDPRSGAELPSSPPSPGAPSGGGDRPGGGSASDAAAGPGPTGFVPPLGAWVDGDRVRFRARSANATRLEVSIFDQPMKAAAKRTVALTRSAGSDTWEAAVVLSDLGGGTIFYGYRAWGPNWTYDPSWTPGSSAGFVADVDGAGNRFNPNKLLVDPYAKEISHDPWQPGTDGSVYAVGANRAKDSAPVAPKSIVAPGDALDTGAKPARPFKDDIVYEVHVRGLTRGDPAIQDCAGTYAAATKKIPHLAALGVTAIELLPLQETPNDTNDTGGGNYWGYSTLAYFAPDRRYACDKSPGGPTREVASMVKAFHDAGIKVFLDVVYNHTAEGGGSSLLSLRGMDNASYYELANDARGFTDNTGIGANVNVANGIVKALVTDSLQYWSRQLGFDGFRFDLAAVLGNKCARGCFDYDKAQGVLSLAHAAVPDAPLVAEPWGIGAGTYELGNFPAGWSEWNGQFRDTIRIQQNQLGVTPVTPGWLSNALSGSPNLFGDDGRGPTGAVNYLVSHDGFTLRDLYSCNAKNNGQAWPYGPSGGGDDNNHSWDHGGDPAQQRQAVRTGLALLMTAAGVPMITGGDELYRTLRCNNNPYNLDSPGNWLDWSALTTEADLVTYAQRLFQFRNAHPALRPAAYRRGTDDDKNGVKDVSWHRVDGHEADGPYMDGAANTFLGFRLDGASAGDPAASIYVAYDGGATAARVTLPPNQPGRRWYSVADTSRATNAFAAPGAEALVVDAYDLAGRSVAIFVER